MAELIGPTFTISSRKRRIAAFIIDLFVVTSIMVSMVFLILGPKFVDENNVERMSTIMSIVMIPGFFLYFAKDSINGISIGRWIMGIMVRNETNSILVPSFWKLFVRNSFTIIWPIEFIVLALDKKKKRIGDKIGKTVVLVNPEQQKRSYRIFALITIGLVFYGFSILFAEASLKSSEAYKVAINNIESNKEIIQETGGITSYGIFPKGQISIINEIGQANLEIKIKGKTKDLKVIVLLEKKFNEMWRVTDLKK